MHLDAQDGRRRRLSRRGQRLEVWLVGKNRGIISRRQGGVILFNPCNIFNRPARGFSHRFSAFLLFHSLSLSLPRLFVSSSLGFILDAPLLPGIHFHAFSWPARSLALPPTRALITNFSVFPRNSRSLHHLLLVDTAFFRTFSFHSSFSLAHPTGHIRVHFGRTGVDKVCACVQIYAKEYSREGKRFFLSPPSLSVFYPLDIASRFRFLVERSFPSPNTKYNFSTR